MSLLGEVLLMYTAVYVRRSVLVLPATYDLVWEFWNKFIP